jgi:glycosyltransferase involved in cell wall biosynthesis
VGKVIVVDNGSAEESRTVLEHVALELDGLVDLVTLPENSGSAGGFQAGLQRARSTDFDFVWILDDDNVPLAGALSELHRNRVAFEKQGYDYRLALLALRERHPGHMAIARGATPAHIFTRSSFLEFDVGTFPRKVIGRLRRKRNAPTALRTSAELPFSPYGGLLLSIRVLDDIGYPDERFFAYADDTELTFRLQSIGGHIMLIPASRVKDIDGPWIPVERGGNGLTRLLKADSDVRAYYSIRNRVYFESHMWVRSPLRYRINKWIYLTLASVVARRLQRRPRLSLMLQAVLDGESGRLGRTFEGLR